MTHAKKEILYSIFIKNEIFQETNQSFFNKYFRKRS